MANCSNCHGTGKIIYTDPKTGKPKGIACGACGGSGQK